MAEFPFKDLRDWMEFIDDKGELVVNNAETDLWEISAISHKVAKSNGPGVLNTKINDFPGWRIAHDVFLTRDRLAWSMGSTKENMFMDGVQKLFVSVPPMEIATGPVKELKLSGDEIDLTMIPTPMTAEFDTVPHFSSFMLNAVDPETGWQNLANRRQMIKTPTSTVLDFVPAQQDTLILHKYYSAGKAMPTVSINGTDPLVYIVSAIKAPVGFAEIELWGAFSGTPMEVVRAETANMYVPARAEIVMEGEAPRDERVVEGPYAEYLGIYSQLAMKPPNRIHTITMREDPIFYYFTHGFPPTEGHNIGDLGIELTVFRDLYDKFGSIILGVRSLSFGAAMVVQVDKNLAREIPGVGKSLAMGAKVRHPWVKICWIIDQDADLHSDWDLLWSMWAKFQGNKDLDIINMTMGTGVDPGERWHYPHMDGFTSFTIIDCSEKPPPFDTYFKRGKALPRKSAMENVEKKWHEMGFR